MLFPSGSQDRLILILDVQSSVVRGSLVHLKKDGPPQILYTYSTSIPWKPHTDSSYLIKVTLRAVDEAVEAVLRSLVMIAAGGAVPKKIKEVHFALSSPWIVSQAKTLTIKFPKDTQITKARIERMIEDERNKIAPKNEDKISVIEQKIFDVRLNGYSVSGWDGMTARELDVSYTVSVAGARMLERFTEACGSAIHGHQPFFHSSLLLQHIALGAIMPNREAYALTHIHGELTDVAVMRRNACIFFASYPFGARTLVRKIAATTKTDFEAADSLLSLYAKGQLDQTHGQEAAKVIADIAQGWSSELKKLFNEQAAACPMPASAIIYAFAHDDFFMQAFKEIYPRVRVERLEISEILPHVSFGEHAERRRLTALYAIAIHTIGDEK